MRLKEGTKGAGLGRRGKRMIVTDERVRMFNRRKA